MPAYDYRCKECGEVVEYNLTVEEKDDFEPKCPECGSEKMKHVFRPARFVFKGTLSND